MGKFSLVVSFFKGGKGIKSKGGKERKHALPVNMLEKADSNAQRAHATARIVCREKEKRQNLVFSKGKRNRAKNGKEIE